MLAGVILAMPRPRPYGQTFAMQAAGRQLVAVVDMEGFEVGILALEVVDRQPWLPLAIPVVVLQSP